MTRRIIVAAVGLIAGCSLLAAQAVIPPRTAERAFSPGGKVWMDLAAGNYRVRAGRDDRVWVQLTTSDPDDIAKCKAVIETKGRDLLVATDGPHGNMHVVIEVPSRSDLHVRLSAGDLRVEKIVGNKDIRSWAGDLIVDVGARDDYRAVHASVTAGDLTARPFDIVKGGLFRSFNWRGSGSYTLDARLTAGDLTLR